MKKIYSILLTAFVLLKLVLPAFACTSADCLTISRTAESTVIYEDQEAGVRFAIPEGWQKRPLNEVRKLIDVKFCRGGDVFPSFLFGATDVWATLSSEDRQGYSRADVNDSFFDKETIRNLIDASSVAIVDEYYAGVHYFRMEWQEKYTVADVQMVVSFTALLHVQNGWEYFFEFAGEQRKTYKADLKEIMGSVKYYNQTNQPVKANFLFPIIAGSIIVLLIIVCVILLLKKNRKIIKPKLTNVGFSERTECCCPYCATSIPKESIFCPVCGKRIVEEGGNK